MGEPARAAGTEPAAPRPGHAAIALLLVALAPSLGVYFAMFFEPTRGLAPGKIIYAAAKIWILVLPLIWMAFVQRRPLTLPRLQRTGLTSGALIGLGIAAAIIAAYLVLGATIIDPAKMHDSAARLGINRTLNYLAVALYMMFINSLLEEYVWRWFVFRRCEELVGPTAGIVLAALLFTVHHTLALAAQTGWLATCLGSVGVFIGGCAWSWCYRRYRSIWPGYVSHVLADAAVFAVGWRVLFES